MLEYWRETHWMDFKTYFRLENLEHLDRNMISYLTSMKFCKFFRPGVRNTLRLTPGHTTSKRHHPPWNVTSSKSRHFILFLQDSQLSTGPGICAEKLFLVADCAEAVYLFMLGFIVETPQKIKTRIFVVKLEK